MSEQPAVYSIAWACLSSWYYGYHLSELNFPVSSLTCLTPSFPPHSRLPLCLGLDKHRYSLVTGIFPVGGLIGSLISSWVVQKEGMKGGLAWTGFLNLAGVVGMAMAPHWVVLAAGRLIVGVSSGIAICLVPPFLSTIAHSSPQLTNRSGQTGTLHQLAIVIGLFSAQVAGLLFTGSKGDDPGSWRYVVTLSGIAALIQVSVAHKVYTPPSELEKARIPPERQASSEGRLSPVPEADEAEAPLLPESASNLPQTPSEQIAIRSLLSNTALRSPALLCTTIMVLQQFSGVNAVMFYSTPVLRPLLPASAGLIGIGITLVNAVMTVPAVFLVDIVGRRSLLLSSVLVMGLMSALLAWGLDTQLQTLSAAAIVLFIAAFSVGLGPVPFLLISELVPPPAIPALSSLSLSSNWIANFLVAVLFLPLRDALSSPRYPGDPLSERYGEGRVFYLFTLVCGILELVVWRGLTAPARAGG